ncbi:hypothetical protein [Streptomyces leeuwenhoekii]|uniref:hypothetical protein n=1 Tax=Streptomyces leeuwenhoekii TaxID=1437453 RepID=UPI0012FE8843|nr:hypothetical protein [Streptomyces leeuwenhoekii]
MAEARPSALEAERDSDIYDPLPHLVLPIQKYIESDDQRRFVAQAAMALVDKCLADKRIKFRLPRRTPDKLPTLMAGRYGPVNQKQAQHGYHYMAVLNGGGSQPSISPNPQESKALSACSDKAEESIPQLEDKNLPEQIKASSYIAATRLPSVVKAFKGWSDCMAETGHKYDSPMDAMNDPKWNWKTAKATPHEVSVATRDVECKKSSGVVQMWFEGEVALEEKKIAEHESALQDVLSQMKQRERSAREVLAKENGHSAT